MIANIILATLFLCVASFAKAIADTLQHHYYESVFRNMPEKFWNPAISYKYVRFIPGTRYRPDAWHIANSIMIASFLVSASINRLSIHWTLQVIIGSAVFILVFNLFYKKLLLNRKS